VQELKSGSFDRWIERIDGAADRWIERITDALLGCLCLVGIFFMLYKLIVMCGG